MDFPLSSDLARRSLRAGQRRLRGGTLTVIVNDVRTGAECDRVIVALIKSVILWCAHNRAYARLPSANLSLAPEPAAT
jgi:hypothetical protein